MKLTCRSGYLVLALLLGLVPAAGAHDANFAAIKVIHQASDRWTFELQTPLHGLEKAMLRYDEKLAPDSDKPATGGRRFKEQIVEYVKAHFDLETSATSIGDLPSTSPALGAGRIRLDNHVSTLIFTIENMPLVIDQ